MYELLSTQKLLNSFHKVCFCISYGSYNEKTTVCLSNANKLAFVMANAGVYCEVRFKRKRIYKTQMYFVLRKL